MTEREHDLDEMFAAARRHAPRPNAVLMGRIAADAARVSPARGWRGLWAVIGGWPALASFGTAAIVGVWLGLAAPQSVETVLETQTYDLGDLMPGYGAVWDEEAG